MSTFVKTKSEMCFFSTKTSPITKDHMKSNLYKETRPLVVLQIFALLTFNQIVGKSFLLEMLIIFSTKL